MEMKVVDIKKVMLNPWNPNKMTERKYQGLKNSIQKFPEVLEGNRIIVRKVDNKYQIINGEHRYKALMELGHKEIPIMDLGKVPDDEAKLLTLTLANVGTEDFDKKLRIIDSILESFDLKSVVETIGESEENIKYLLDNLETSVEDIKESTKSTFAEFQESNKDEVKEEDAGMFDEAVFMKEIGVLETDENGNTGIDTIDKKKNLPPQFMIPVQGNPIVMEALKLGVNKGFKNHQDTIDKACACFHRNHRKQMKALEAENSGQSI